MLILQYFMSILSWVEDKLPLETWIDKGVTFFKDMQFFQQLISVGILAVIVVFGFFGLLKALSKLIIIAVVAFVIYVLYSNGTFDSIFSS